MLVGSGGTEIGKESYHSAAGIVPKPVVFGPVMNGVAIFGFEVRGDGAHHLLGVVAIGCDVLLGYLLEDHWVKDELSMDILVEGVKNGD